MSENRITIGGREVLKLDPIIPTDLPVQVLRSLWPQVVRQAAMAKASIDLSTFRFRLYADPNFGTMAEVEVQAVQHTVDQP